MVVSTPLSTEVLESTLRLVQQQGLQATSDATVAKALGVAEAELAARYPDRAALIRELVLADLERQKRGHTTLYQECPTAVDRLYGLLRYTLHDLQTTPPAFYTELRQNFPAIWEEVVMAHLASYSFPQLQQLLNHGIRQGLLRSDINIQLVTTILLEQLNMVLNPQVFPPERYNLAEVFRSIFLYYIRGICTEEGARLAAENFARI